MSTPTLMKLANKIKNYRQHKEAAKRLMQRGDLSAYIMELSEIRKEKRQIRSLLSPVAADL